MAVAEARAIANAVALALNDAREASSLPGSWEASAVEQVPEFTREQLAQTKVTVVTVNRRKFRETRPPNSLWRYEYDVDVGVQGVLDNTQPDPINEALILAELIDDWFTDDDNDTLTLVDAESGATSAECIGSQLAFLSSEHLEQLGVASSVTRLTFHLWRQS